jgi:3-hydroxy-D-aspartate aldolase
MPKLPPALPGMPLEDVDTPALLIDLEAFERNLKTMADAVAKAGVRLRPHAKTHKSPIIGLKQMALGAVGMCCQKVSEAEALVEGGIPDVYVSNEIVGARKLDRLAALAHQARVMVAVDDPASIEALGAAARKAGVTLRTLVEIDVGGNRCGVEPGAAAVPLAERIGREQGLTFAGLQAYHGRAQHLRTVEERQTAIRSAIEKTALTVSHLRRAGLDCEVVGGAGTGTFDIEAASGVYNELQAGSYVFMDADYARNKRADGGRYDTFAHALYVYATVMSTPVPERAVCDAGLKALAFDTGMPDVPGLAGAVYERPSDEHGTLNVSACNVRPRSGDKVLLIPGHCDPTVNLHDWYVGIRGMGTSSARVEAVWPVAARGAVF